MSYDLKNQNDLVNELERVGCLGVFHNIMMELDYFPVDEKAVVVEFVKIEGVRHRLAVTFVRNEGKGDHLWRSWSFDHLTLEKRERGS
ncbi:hypothetical protein [Bacillus safensis]|uniref:hypothetical protein n=1 Tax=Bacillus safensis TaxID=561879 RepID=UPI000597C42B|nr:hypothetical protein [Bacillus safensis]